MIRNDIRKIISDYYYPAPTDFIIEKIITVIKNALPSVDRGYAFEAGQESYRSKVIELLNER